MKKLMMFSGLAWAAALAAGPAAAAPPKPVEPPAVRRLDAPVPRVRHHRTRVMQSLRRARSVRDIPYRGRVESVGDGVVRLSQPVAKSTRTAISDERKIPLAQVPEKSFRTVYLLGPGPRAREVEALIGKEVEATLTMNDRGYFLLADLEPASSKPE